MYIPFNQGFHTYLLSFLYIKQKYKIKIVVDQRVVGTNNQAEAWTYEGESEGEGVVFIIISGDSDGSSESETTGSNVSTSMILNGLQYIAGVQLDLYNGPSTPRQ